MSKKIKVVIECDEDYVVENLHNLASYIECETDMDYEQMGRITLGGCVADVSVVKDTPKVTNKPYEIPEEKLKRFVDGGGDLSSHDIFVQDNDGDLVQLFDVFLDDNRYWGRTEYGQTYLLNTFQIDELERIESAIDDVLKNAE